MALTMLSKDELLTVKAGKKSGDLLPGDVLPGDDSDNDHLKPQHDPKMVKDSSIT